MPRAELLELSARAVGVIDDAAVEFAPGFNVITGETGAGKTLLLGALDLCLGGDGGGARLGAGEGLAAAAVFRTPEGAEVALGRASGGQGRLRSSLDGAASSAEALRAIAARLVVVHGQHDSLALRGRSEVRALLDRSGGVATAELEAARRALAGLAAERDALGGDAAAREREADYVAFQVAELEAARVTGPGELDERLAELSRLTELAEGRAALAAALEELDGEGEGAVLARLARVVASLPRGSALDPARTELAGALATAREAARDLAALVGDAPDDARVAELDERVGVLQSLARKFGGSLEEALAELARLRQRSAVLADAEGRRERLDAEVDSVATEVARLAKAARAEREAAADRLNAALAAQLPRVALGGATLRFSVDGEDGSAVDLLFAPNPGRPEGPLSALASGGELSRVLLALALETVHDEVVAVFDEIDAGVGGQVAQQIGQCLRELGHEQQVLAVTHLASVAAQADHHVVIEKSVARGRTTTRVRVVTGEDRVREVARMLAGDRLTDESLALAAQLLETRS